MAEADSVVDEAAVVTVSVVTGLTKDLLTKLFYHNHLDFESRCIANFAEVSALVHACEGEAVTKLTNEKIPYFNASIYLQNKTQIGKVDEIFGPINESGGKVLKEMDALHGSPLEAGPTTHLPEKNLLFILDRLQNREETRAVLSEPIDPFENNLRSLALLGANSTRFFNLILKNWRLASSIQELAKRDFDNSGLYTSISKKGF
ncbi:hypothetical protein LXL04_031056 [Taraxacum kok-saghyz]